MNISKQRGILGEQVVKKYVVNRGMKFILSNYHSRYGEIDIICEDRGCIVFIEVKTRKERSIVGGIEAIDRRKQAKIIKTAYLYIQENNIDLQPRFDVAEVRCNNQGKAVRVNYISNAFDLEGYDEFF